MPNTSLSYENLHGQIQKCHESHEFRRIVARTPMQISTSLSVFNAKENDVGNVQSSEKKQIVTFKCDHMQQTGSFKLRGITNCLLTHISKTQSGQTLPHFYTASTGNHGFATAYASLHLPQVHTNIFVPNNASQSKIQRIEQCVEQGAGRIEMQKYGDNCLDSELEAKRRAQESNGVYISPYNDEHVLCGQGTIGMEISEQFVEVLGEESQGFDAVFVSVGGGGIISGISIALKNEMQRRGLKVPRIYGVQPVNSSVMYQSVREGRILQDVHEEETLSDGTAGGIEDDSITFEICQNLVDEWVCCSEAEIHSAWLHLMEEERMLVEGSAALALAGYLKVREQLQGKSVCVVLCGRNITLEKVVKLMRTGKEE